MVLKLKIYTAPSKLDKQITLMYFVKPNNDQNYHSQSSE